MIEYKLIQLERADGIAIVTLNHPEKLNALSQQMLGELTAAVKELEAEEDIRVVILTGTGKAFVAGADITGMSGMTAKEAGEYSAYTVALYQLIGASSKIYIAAVNGYAFGGGCELALACDLRIASETARFALPEVGLGIIPGGLGTQNLPRVVGMQKAMELILTGDNVSGEAAARLGLVLEVTEAGQLMDHARLLAARMLKNAPVAISYAKRCIRQSAEMPLSAGAQFENAMFGLCFDTKDQKEGMQAFLEKRKPHYEGR